MLTIPPPHLKLSFSLSSIARTLFTVASSITTDILELATSYIQSFYKSLPSSLQDQLANASKSLNEIRQQPRIESTFVPKNLSPETILAILLPSLILLFSMSTWKNRFWSSGRYSPFGPTPVGGPPPIVSESDYQYLESDEIDPPRVHHPNDGYGFPQHRNATRVDGSHHSPDILILKHRGTTYPLHLAAFSVGEGLITVGQLRRLAAEKTKTDDPRRVKLLYKGNVLKDNDRACRDEGLKQNSELTCVIIEAGSREDVESSDSADSEEMLANGLGGPRIEVDGTIRDPRPKRRNHRGGRRKTRTRDSSIVTPRDSSGYLAPDPIPSARAPSPSPRSASPLPQPHAHAHVGPSASASPPDPKTPLGALEAISYTFQTTFMPKCRQFMSHPPVEVKAREMEYKKLSETILTQIIMKLDAVETEGDEGLRAKRKELVRETQAVLTELDRVGKAIR